MAKTRKFSFETKAARLRKRSLVRRWCQNCGREVVHTVTDQPGGWERQECMGCKAVKTYRTR